MGGDNAPLAMIEGAINAKKEYNEDIVLCGNKEKIENCAKENNLDISGFEIMHAETEIFMNDEPTDVLKAKADCSMAVGLKATAEGKGDAFLSAGNSGALTVGATMIVKRIKGVKRVTFTTVMPHSNGFSMFTDAGANLECRPEMLVQFALLASVYMKKVMNIQNPKVGILNVGTEEHKGRELEKNTYHLLQENKNLNFIGNVEGRDLPSGKADIIITDGFTGNVALKTFEGVALMLMSEIKGVFMSNLLTKIAAMMIMKKFKGLKAKIDYKEYGGAPIMGCTKPVFKIHGSADARAVKNAINLTIKYAKSGVVEEMAKALSAEK